MTEDQIKHMVNRFLGWKLPINFNPDAGISYTPLSYSSVTPPTGTNLFDVTQADAMVRYMIKGIPDLQMICGACGDIWQEGMSCGQKDNGHPFRTCYPCPAVPD